jgi:hypothetical protein
MCERSASYRRTIGANQDMFIHAELSSRMLQTQCFSNSEKVDKVTGRNIKMLMPSALTKNVIILDRYLATLERRIIGIGRVVVGELSLANKSKSQHQVITRSVVAC